MNTNLQQMMQDQAEALKAANAMVTAAEQGRRELTPAENEKYNESMNKFRSLGATIQAKKEQNTILSCFANGKPNAALSVGLTNGTFQPEAPIGTPDASRAFAERQAATRRPEYKAALNSFFSSRCKVHSEALLVGADEAGGYYWPGSERWTRQANANGIPKMRADLSEGTEGGSGAAGGYAIDIVTSNLIVQLALPDMGVYNASTVIPTATDLKVPQQLTFGTSAIKQESATGSIATFGGTDPSLEQTTLTSYMIGAARYASWELLQDVPAFQSFITEDLCNGQRIEEGAFLATGTGTGQPQGVFGNTGVGTGSAYELAGTSADAQLLIDSLFDVQGQLKSAYFPNASWLMNRQTAVAIRRASMQANLFAPVTRLGPDGTLYVLDAPVYFDANAPALPTATSAGVPAILFGDFRQGNMIGVRGGGGINIKVLDQPAALQGQLIILAYRRIDARVRRSEAMQQILISHS